MGSLRDASLVLPPQTAGRSLRDLTVGGGMTPDEAVASSASVSNPFEAGVKSTIRGTLGATKAFAGGVTEGLGGDGTDLYDAAARDAQQAAVIGPQVRTLDQITGPGEAAAYAMGHAGAFAPYFALGGAGGVGMRALNRAAGMGMSGNAAAHLGATAAFLPSMAGDQMAQMHELAPEMSPGERLTRGLATGAAQAVVGAVPGSILARTPIAQSFTKGFGRAVGESAASEAGEDIIGQANRMDYQPGYQYNPRDTLEAAAAGAVGMAPVAGGHGAAGAIAKHSMDGARAVGDTGKELIDAAGKAAAPAAEGLMDKLDAADQAAGQYVDDVRGVMNTDDQSVNVGLAAAKVTGDVKEAVSKIAEDTLPHITETLGDIVHHTRSNESRLRKTLGELSTPPELDGSVDLPRAFGEREGFFRSMSDWYASRGEMGQSGVEQMTRAADSIKAINENPNLTADEIRSNWEQVAAAADRVNGELAKTKGQAGFHALSKWLDTKDTKYAGLMPPAERADIRRSQWFEVADNRIADVVHRVNLDRFRTAPETAANRAEALSTLRKVTYEMLDGRELTPEAEKAFDEFLDDNYGSSAGRVKGAIASIVQQAKSGETNAANADGRTDVHTYISKMLTKQNTPQADARVSEAIALIREADALAEKWSGREDIDPRDVPHSILKAVAARIDAREAAGLPAHADLREVLLEELRSATDTELRKHFEGKIEKVKEAVREMNASHSRGIKRSMGDITGALGRDFVDEHELAIRREEGLEDEKPDWENENGLNIVGPGERAVHDTDRPRSGQTTADDLHEGYRGELGTEKKRLMELYGDRAEVDHVNILDHVSKMSREAGQTDEDVLNAVRSQVVDHENQRAIDIRDELESGGIDVTDATNFLNQEYGRSMRGKKDVAGTSEPWEVFDGTKALEEKYGMDRRQAQQLNDLYWAEARRDFPGTGREFFERFKHSYPTARSTGSSQERMDFYDMSKGNLTSDQMSKRGITKVAPEAGVLSYTNAEGETAYLDLPKLLEHALGKVRTRTEVVDEMGNKEKYDDNLYNPDGSVNEAYVADMRAALASTIVSMAESKDHAMTPETERILLGEKKDGAREWEPTYDLLLKRGKNGVGDVTLGDLLSTEKVVQFSAKQRKDIVRPAEKIPMLGRFAKGLLWGTESKPLTKNGVPVVVDTHAVIAHTAKILGVSLKDAPAETYFALLNEGIAALRRSNAVDDLPMPTIQTRDTAKKNSKVEHTLDARYRNLVIGDKPYTVASGDEGGTQRIAGTPRTQVILDKATGPKVDRLGSSNRFTLDNTDRSVASLEGFATALTVELENRGVRYNEKTQSWEVGEPPRKGQNSLNAKRLAEIEKEKRPVAEALKQAELENRIDRPAEKRMRELVSEEVRLNKEERDAGREARKKETINEGEIEHNRKMDNADYEREGKSATREDLEGLSINHLIAKIRNVSERAGDLRGEGQEKVFVPTDGTTSNHEQTRGRITQTDVKTKTVSATNSEHVIETKAGRGEQVIPETTEAAERKTVTSKVPGTLPVQDHAALRAAMKKPAAKVDAAAAPATRKADPHLQRLIDDLTANKPADTAMLGPEGIKTWYDAAKAIDTPAARNAVRTIESYAHMEGVDPATGKYSETQQLHRVSLEDADGAKAGRAELRFNGEDFEVVQGGKVVGAILANASNQKILEGADTADITRVGQRFVVDVHGKMVSDEMKPYKGNEDVPVIARKTLKSNLNPEGPRAAGEKHSRIIFKDGTVFGEDDPAAAIKILDQMFNGNVSTIHDALYDQNGKPVAGKTVPAPGTPAGFVIRLSLGAKSMLGSTAMHESLHGLFKILGQTEHGKAAWEKLSKSLLGPIVQARLDRILDKLPLDAETRASVKAAIKADPEEAAAYAFQFWTLGNLELGPEGNSFFRRVGKFIRNLLSITTEYERSEAFFSAFISGDLARADFKPSALEKAFNEQRGDQITKAIKEHAEPFMQVVHTVFDSSRQAMERLNSKDATELMRKYIGHGDGEGYIKRVRIESNIHASKVQKLMERYKPEELRGAIGELYAGEAKSAAAKDVQKFIRELNTYAGKPKDELPTIWDHEKISRNRKDFDKAIADFGMVKERSPGNAVFDLISDMGYGDQSTKSSQVEFHPQYDQQRAKWIQTDPSKFMRSLIVQTVKRKEHSKIFKPAEVEGTLEIIRAKHGDDAYFKAKDFVDGMEGRLGTNMSPGLRNMMRAALTVGNVVTLPLSLFSAAVDPFHLASRSNNLGNAATAYAAGVGSIFKSVNELFGGKSKNTAAENFAEEIGAIEHATMVDVLGDVYLGDQAEGWTKRVNDWFFKANMLDGWTRQMRVAAVTAGQRFIIEHAKGKGKHSKHFMEELGLTAKDVSVGADGNLVINDKVKMALNKFVDESVVRPDQGTNAIWMNDPRFALLSHMKRFTFAFTENVLNRSMNEMQRGNAVPLAMLMASIPAILAADMGKHMLKGDYDTWMNNKTVGNWFEYGMNRSGLNGKMQFGLDAVHDLEMGGTPFESAMGPDLGLLRKMLAEPHHAMVGEHGFDLIGLIDGGMHAAQGVQAVQGAKAAK